MLKPSWTHLQKYTQKYISGIAYGPIYKNTHTKIYFRYSLEQFGMGYNYIYLVKVRVIASWFSKL